MSYARSYLRYDIPPRMFCSGSNVFHAKRSDVSGMSCISPCAFLGETAVGSKLDSALMTAITKRGLTPYSGASFLTKSTTFIRSGLLKNSSISDQYHPQQRACTQASGPPNHRRSATFSVLVDSRQRPPSLKKYAAVSSLRTTPRPFAYIQPKNWASASPERAPSQYKRTARSGSFGTPSPCLQDRASARIDSNSAWESTLMR